MLTIKRSPEIGEEKPPALILFQPFIHSGKAAIRFIAGDIKKGAFLPADGAGLRRFDLDDSIAAITAFPGIFRNIGFIFCHYY